MVTDKMAHTVTDAEINAFREKYREIFPGSHPDRQTIIELLTASKKAVSVASDAFRSTLTAALAHREAEAVAWQYRWKGTAGEWSAWIVTDLGDPNDWTWPHYWKDMEARPLYAAPPADDVREALRQIADLEGQAGAGGKAVNIAKAALAATEGRKNG